MKLKEVRRLTPELGIFLKELEEVRRSYRFAEKLEDGLTPELGIKNYELGV